MPAVRVQRVLDVPGAPVFAALEEVLRRIAAQEEPYQGFALHADLGDAGLPTSDTSPCRSP